MELLHGYLPSYDKQIEKAYKRGDLVSINHRIAEFLASYFDIIFALNEVTHPGEKKLIPLCLKLCKLLPNDFEENLVKLFHSMYEGNELVTNVARVITEITNLVENNKDQF